MAIAESTPVTVRQRSFTAQDRHAVGRLGPWLLVRLLNERNLTRTYLARPGAATIDAEADSAGTDAEFASRPAAYVVKLLRKEFWRDTQAIEMQRREAWVGCRVSHPNLLPVLSASVGEPPFYVVTPRLEGATLAQVLSRQGPLPLSASLWIARQVADGLGALADATGMIHSDVNPANVIVSPTGHATLIDFGLAQTPAEASRWETREIAGTLPYMAPEMFTSALAATTRSDIYSLGVTLYELLAGERPFHDEAPSDLARRHREERPADIRDHRPNVPTAVAELLQTMLAKDPLRRPATPRELSRRLIRLEIDNFST